METKAVYIANRKSFLKVFEHDRLQQVPKYLAKETQI